MSFTPGPWFVGAQNDALFIIDKKPHPVPVDYITESLDVSVIAKLDPATRIAQADARLIAAAPDLLEALKRVMAGFDAGVWIRSTKDDVSPDWAVKIIGHVQALGAAVVAIAKAEGR